MNSGKHEVLWRNEEKIILKGERWILNVVVV